jgi:hypothetical protein
VLRCDSLKEQMNVLIRRICHRRVQRWFQWVA